MISVFTVNSLAYGQGFSGNGDMTLIPSSCEFTANLNGDWYLDMVHPLDPDGRWQWIEEEAVLKVPTWHDTPQLFRIAEIEKAEKEIKVLAYPIFYDCKNNFFIEDITARGTCQSVLNALLGAAPAVSGSPIYTVSSNITKVKKIRIERRNFLDALNGSEEPTIISTFGGEIKFDNFSVYVGSSLGTNHNAEVRYGKNIKGIDYTIDYSEMCTRIYPQSHGGYAISSGNRWEDSPLVNNYGILYVKNMVFDNIRLLEDVGENEDTSNLTVCADHAALDTALRAACQAEFNKGIDKPKVNMTIDMVAVEDTEQYASFSETISLGDDVSCVHEKLGVSSKARAVNIVWDCIRNRCAKVQLGDFAFDYFKDVSSKIDSIASIIAPDGSVVAEKVAGVINSAQTFIRGIRSTATASKSVAILFEDKVSGSPTYGALGIGTQGILIADTWNSSIGDWDWTTACTGKGIIADTIVTGTISDKAAKNYWDLENSEFHFELETDDILDTLEAEDVANKLFDGNVEGFATSGGHFYISCTLLKGGNLILGGRDNGNGTFRLNDANGNQIIGMDNSGFACSTINGWGTETMRISEAILHGVVNGVEYSKIDMATQYGDGIALYIENNMSTYNGHANLEGIIFSAHQHGFIDRYRNIMANFSMGETLIRTDQTRILSRDTPIMTLTDSLITAHTSTSWDSDYRLKENIKTSEIDAESLNRLDIVSFDWKDKRKPHVEAGLVAQDVQKILPELVHEGEDGMLGINYVGMIPYLLKMIQNQNAQIKELYSMIKSVKGFDI